MKRITLLSDTHGHLDDRIRELCTWGDEIWHAGDIGNIAVADELKTIKPFKAVFGNIDGTQARADYPLHNRFMCEDVDVWITHIGGYPNRYNARIKEEIQRFFESDKKGLRVYEIKKRLDFINERLCYLSCDDLVEGNINDRLATL